MAFRGNRSLHFFLFRWNSQRRLCLLERVLSRAAVRSARHWAVAVAAAIAVTSMDVAAIVVVTEPWAPPTAAAARSTEVYVEITSTEEATLVGVRCADAATVVLRAPGARAAPLREIALPAGRTVKLTSKGNRIALRGLSRSLTLEDRVPLVLIVKSANGELQEIRVSAEVRLHSPTEDHLRPHKH